jgi:hypothetical protein
MHPDEPFRARRREVVLPRALRIAPALDRDAPKTRVTPRSALLVNPF